MEPVELGDLDPFGLFDAEAARLDRCFSPLDQAGWRAPSRCVGWSVRDVLAHLAGEELYNHACLDGDVAGFFARLHREGVGGSGSFGDFNQWCVRQRRPLPVEQVLAEWRAANGQTRRRMRELGRDGLLETSTGRYPAGLQTFHYASEYATHADDVGAPVGAGEEPGRIRWRASVGRFALREQGAPVEVAATGRGVVVRVADLTAELSERDFVTATVARLPEDHALDRRVRDALACLA
jgi:uncharacterized protein (TIGR03083 family)